MHVLYEEDGTFKVGTVLADQAASLQVEAPHGKRSKVKTANVMLQFKAPAAGEFLPAAERVAADIDTDFLWECCGENEFSFSDMAVDYFGRAPEPVEAAGVLLRLHGAPVYFYRRGKGRYKAATAETLKAALAALDRRRQQDAAIAAFVEQLHRFELPESFRPLLTDLLYRPDPNRPETKALNLACKELRLSAARLFERCGALPSSHAYHRDRFLYEYFPRGTAIEIDYVGPPFDHLPLAAVQAFSIDDVMTTEIDDAFSFEELTGGHWRVGIHIAAPALGFDPESGPGGLARQRLSTVYMPGDKITMLPERVIRHFTLAEGEVKPALSMYLEVDPATMTIVGRKSRIERVPVAANLRNPHLEPLFEGRTQDQGIAEHAYARELSALWQLTGQLEKSRGKQSIEQVDYNFYVIDDRVTISERRRGAPLDKLVAELMIHANSSWGKDLADAGVSGLYRAQANGKVRMTTLPAPHQGLGVEQYAWCTSPLRRYVDLVNQWQLLAVFESSEAPFAAGGDALLTAMRDFELAYASYDEFQRRMERYWCLRWLLQENVLECGATVIRENLIKLDSLPLYLRVTSLPPTEPGRQVRLTVGDVDLLELELHCEFRALA